MSSESISYHYYRLEEAGLGANLDHWELQNLFSSVDDANCVQGRLIAWHDLRTEQNAWALEVKQYGIKWDACFGS